MSERLTDEQLAAIEAAIVHDPFGHMPDSVFRQAGTFRPKLDGIPVEIKRADLRALLADLRAARQERDQAREALRAVEWAAKSQYNESYCVLCGTIHGTSHTPDCLIGNALAVTEETPCEDCPTTPVQHCCNWQVDTTKEEKADG